MEEAATNAKIEASDAQLHRLMHAYLRPSAFPDVTEALDALQGAPLAILSNGSPKMLDSAVQHNGLTSYFAEIISVDRVKTYKPSPRVYALAPEVLGFPPEEILFVSSNSWDVAGAKAFGYKVCWCNRSQGHMEHLGVSADVTVLRSTKSQIVSRKEYLRPATVYTDGCPDCRESPKKSFSSA